MIRKKKKKQHWFWNITIIKMARFYENKLFWKEVSRGEWKYENEERGWRSCRQQRDTGTMEGVWKRRNSKEGSNIHTIGMKTVGDGAYMQRIISKHEVQKTIVGLNCGKAMGINRITVEKNIYSEEVVVV